MLRIAVSNLVSCAFSTVPICPLEYFCKPATHIACLSGQIFTFINRSLPYDAHNVRGEHGDEGMGLQASVLNPLSMTLPQPCREELSSSFCP